MKSTFAALSIAVAASAASADTVRIDLVGTVDLSVLDPAQATIPFEASATFDTTVTGTIIVFTPPFLFDTYSFGDALIGFDIALGGDTLALAGPADVIQDGFPEVRTTFDFADNGLGATGGRLNLVANFSEPLLDESVLLSNATPGETLIDGYDLGAPYLNLFFDTGGGSVSVTADVASGRVAPVPLPASGLLLLAGIAAIARRRA